MSKLPESQKDCCHTTKLKEFSEKFKLLYSFLNSYGEKKQLHIEIVNQTSPQVSESTVRGYCNNPNSIPEKFTDFYIRCMSELLYREIEKKIALANQFITDVQPFEESLKTSVIEYFNSKNNGNSN